MCPQDNEYGNIHDFEEMMERWDIKLPEEKEKPEPLGIDTLIEKWCKDKYKWPNDAVKALKEGQKHIEASAVLFGRCYANLSPSFFGWTLKQCIEYELELIDEMESNIFAKERLHIKQDLIIVESDSLSEQVFYPEDRDCHATKSYVDVLLAAASALAFFSGGKKKAYDPYLNETLEKAYEVIKRGGVREAESFSELQFYNDGQHLSGDVVGFLSCLACAVVCYALAETLSKLKPDYDRNYETAFKAYVKGAKYILKIGYQINLFVDLFVGDESETEDVYWNIIDVWEQLKKNLGRVQNWRELHGCLLELEDIMYQEDHNTDIGLYPLDEPGFVYLPRQLSLCDGRLSQEEIHELIEQPKKKQQKDRLQNDFFEGLWQYLEDKTKDFLIEAEHKWYDNPTKDSRKKVFVDYSVALETELVAIIFQNHEVNSRIKRILRKRKKDKDYRKLMDLNSLKVDSLYLSDMSKLLQYIRENRTENIRPDVKPIEDAIFALPIPEDEERIRGLKLFLTEKETTHDLSDIYSIRNLGVHRIPEGEVISRMHDLRRRILGIGCEGYLMKLAEIKRFIDASRRH